MNHRGRKEIKTLKSVTCLMGINLIALSQKEQISAIIFRRAEIAPAPMYGNCCYSVARASISRGIFSTGKNGMSRKKAGNMKFNEGGGRHSGSGLPVKKEGWSALDTKGWKLFPELVVVEKIT